MFIEAREHDVQVNQFLPQQELSIETIFFRLSFLFYKDEI
jgi:hypothetical protein